MKILQLIHKQQPRGAETFAAQLTDNLTLLGQTSRLVAIYKSSPAEAAKYNREAQVVNADATARFWDMKGWRKLAKIIAAEAPDVVQANAGDTLKYAVFSKLFFRWKQPIIFRNASTLSSYLRNPLQKAFTRFLFSRTDAVASVSEFSRQDLVGLFPKLASRAVTIPIGLEHKKPVSDPFPAEFAQQVKLVHVGGFTFEKNHKSLLRIFKIVLETIPDAQLWLVGDGPLRAEVEAFVEEIGVKNQVYFTGFVHNPLDYISHAQALLLPSIIEGLPAVILEAMLYETPVIANKVGGIGEVVTPGKTGWLVSPGDEKGFAKAIVEAIANENGKTDEIIAEANKIIRKEYMNKHIAERFVQLYESIIR